MIASQRTGEITFYEELGLAPGASPQEIRDAFRALVRLLHPDQQTDPQLKYIAEKQMRKVNRIYAVLSDPERRRRYDEALDQDYPPTVILGAISDPGFRQSVAKMTWIAAVGVSAFLLVLLTWESTPGAQIHARDQNTEQNQAPSPSQSSENSADQSFLLARLRSDLKAITLERDAAIHELGRLRGPKAPPPSPTAARSEGTESGLPVLTTTELPSTGRFPVLNNSVPNRIENQPSRKFGGFWFYTPPALGLHNKNQSLYPPEYIEATIKEENGMLSGKYRARFQIVDRAISPDVNFTFIGASSSGTQMTFPWTGSAGAKGELTLRLVSENSLRIDWNATELGSQQGLDAGTAILTRRIE
jgi:curved DNA-binding protein CbpA